jgi:hypothetical protein
MLKKLVLQVGAALMRFEVLTVVIKIKTLENDTV